MAPPLRQDIAQQVVRTARKLGRGASFRNILLEVNSQGILADHRTLRRYLDLLVCAGILKVRERDVGSVHRQQLYRVVDPAAHLWAGPTVMRVHGLNWDVSETQLCPWVTEDLEAIVRGKPYRYKGGSMLLAGLEDSLAFLAGADWLRPSCSG